MEWRALVAVVATLVLIAVRPRGIGEAWVVAGGAGTMGLLGAPGPGDVWSVLRETADVLLFLLEMMVLTWLAERVGVFDRLAEGIAGLARGSGLRGGRG